MHWWILPKRNLSLCSATQTNRIFRQDNLMNQSRPNSLTVSLLINAVLFGGVLAFSFPIFNSGDDVYLLYLLGGGFGQAPTELLHYHYGMHPYVGLVLKNLFVQWPGFNWYAALLYLFHFVACVVLLMRCNKFIFLLIFFCIEARFLLQPTFTNTALVTAMAGALLLHDKKIPLGYILLVAASLLRLHMLIPVIVIAAPFMFNKKAAMHLAIIAVIVTGFVLLQQQYYTQHIPGWKQEETYRQTIINYYNKPKKLIDPFIESGILFNRQLPQPTVAVQQHNQSLYWLLMENRVALLLMLLVLTYASRRARVAAALLLAMCAYLFLFRKLPPYIVPGCIMVWLAFAVDNERRGCGFTIISIALLCWSVIRLNKLNEWNRQQYERWSCAYKMVSAQPGKLFVVTDDQFPMDFFHVWNTPHQYPMPNLLYKDHFLNNTYQPIYKKFNITSPQDFLRSENVLFTGEHSSLMFEFYKGTNIILIPVPNNCVSTFRIKPAFLTPATGSDF